MQVHRWRASDDFLTQNGGSRRYLLQANNSRRQVRAHHTPPAAPLAPPAPATRPEASQALPVTSLPASGPFRDTRDMHDSRTQPSLPPQHRSNRLCPPMPCRAARSRAQELWRLWRRVATAGDDLGDGRRRLGQLRRPRAEPLWPPDPPEPTTSLADAAAACRRGSVTGRVQGGGMRSLT